MVSELVTRSRGGYECYPLYAERERMLARVKDDDKTAKDIISAVDVARSIRETNISRDQQVGTTVASADKEKVMVAWESHAAKNDAWGREIKSETLSPLTHRLANWAYRRKARKSHGQRRSKSIAEL